MKDTMITILRLGHRKDRDKRASMHVALVARALGADSIVISGEQDDELLQRIATVGQKWGGKFKAEYTESYRTTLKKFKGKKVHLTMYGMPLQDVAPKVASEKNLMFVVGSEKVPRDVYEMCDYNIAVTNQPHSEIAALALTMRECCGTRIYSQRFPKGKLRILPSESGKNVEKI